jgi:uncharacterized membrane protein
MMGIAANATSAWGRLAQLRAAQRTMVARQKALRPLIREANERGEAEKARALHDELRALRVRLRQVQREERELRAGNGERADSPRSPAPE